LLAWTIAAACVSAAAIVAMPVHAEDVGRHGSSYALDGDAREQFKAVLKRKQASGELDRFWAHYRQQTLAAIREPAPLPIKTNYGMRSSLHRAVYVMPRDHVDQQGRLVAARGTLIEPLKQLPLTSGLLFIDGRDEQQVSYAVRLARAEPVKIVLIGGSALTLSQQYRRERAGQGIPFFWDQRGMITDGLRRLYGIDIATVPALMRQDGAALRLDFGIQAGLLRQASVAPTVPMSGSAPTPLASSSSEHAATKRAPS
jgi:conjugal transfer pilus assembly protein TraW